MDDFDNEIDESVENKKPSALDSVSQNAAHLAGKKTAEALAPGVGGKLYEVASKTKIGQALEDKIAKKIGFKIKIYIAVGCLAFIILFVLMFVIIDDDDGGSSSSDRVCTTLPAVDSICDSVTVLNKSGGVIETVSLDDYVAGVITGEVGGFQDDSLNVQKVFAIAARSYALSRATKTGNNCSIESSTSFQVYSSKHNDTAVTAANETSGIVLVKDGSIQATEYDAFCFDSRDSSYYTMCQGDPLKIPTSWVNANVHGKVCADSSCSSYIDYKTNDGKVSHHGRGMSQYGAYYLSIAENKSYDEILNYFYSKNGITLASLGTDKTTCSSSGSSSSGCYNGLDEYPLKGGNATKLDTPLNTKLNSSQIEEINNSIINSIESAGYGTGDAVAAAATAFIMGLYDSGYYLPYYYGGGHSGYTGDSDNHLTIGINPVFGKTTTSTGESTMRNKLSLDCSGFVSWAIKNAVKSDFVGATSGAFVGYGKKISFSEVTPGDVFANSGHIILVVKNNGDGSVITAESTSSGIIFNRVTASDVSQYSIVDMDDYYAGIKDETDPYGGTGGTCKKN